MHVQSPSPSKSGDAREDSWIGVQDARTRKTIQDRLAQRARRRRLTESKKRAQASQSGSVKPAKLAPRLRKELPNSVEAVSPQDIMPIPPKISSSTVTKMNDPPLETRLSHGQPTSEMDGESISLVSQFEMSHPGTDSLFLTIPNFTIFTAMFAHGQMLGLSCLFPVPRSSTPPTVDIPIPLHPVPLQMEVPHLPYIDCLPQPKLRHNLILFNGLFDDEAFCYDLLGSSNFIFGGSQSWDPTAWKISADFRERWAMFFD